jgi:hypothetical protein
MRLSGRDKMAVITKMLLADAAFLTSKTMQWRVSKRKGPGIGQTHKASRVLGPRGVHYPK